MFSFLISDLPSQPVDLVIDALSNSDNNETQYHWLPWVIEWANHNKAPVLALDPCIRSSKPGQMSAFDFSELKTNIFALKRLFVKRR